jgi:hypothetical protein
MPGHGYRDTLEHRGLQPFLWTQFLGAFNDNLFKIVVSMVAVHAATSANCRSCCFPATPANSRTYTASEPSWS